MARKRTLRIGLLGFGTVGQGVWKHLENNRHNLELRLGAKLELTGAAVSDLAKPRTVQVPAGKLTDRPQDIVDDPKVDIVCELMGGVEAARELTLRALDQGKVVVTANKALICEHGAELFAAAVKGGTHYFFEASVAGGIPIIKTLREGLVANRFPLIFGILNGTSNYILTRMEREQNNFGPILEDARKLGYVEADEALDLDGWDAAHKAVILAYLAHGKWVKLSEMVVEGIRGITLDDIIYTRELGYKIKLLAVIARDFEHNRLHLRLAPALLPREHMMASVDGVYNGISLTGDVVGTTLLVGRGAGQDATASAVISDIADAASELLGGPPPPVSEEDLETYHKLAEGCTLAAPEEIESSYYLRLHVKDQPGVLAHIARLFADHGLSIATMLQRDQPEQGTATILLTTHMANEHACAKARKALDRCDFVLAPPFALRVFEPPAV